MNFSAAINSNVLASASLRVQALCAAALVSGCTTATSGDANILVRAKDEAVKSDVEYLRFQGGYGDGAAAGQQIDMVVMPNDLLTCSFHTPSPFIALHSKNELARSADGDTSFYQHTNPTVFKKLSEAFSLPFESLPGDHNFTVSIMFGADVLTTTYLNTGDPTLVALENLMQDHAPKCWMWG